MLNDVRSQIYQNKTMYETEMVKMESRLSTRIEESIRNNEKFVSLFAKLSDLLTMTDSISKELLITCRN